MTQEETRSIAQLKRDAPYTWAACQLPYRLYHKYHPRQSLICTSACGFIFIEPSDAEIIQFFSTIDPLAQGTIVAGDGDLKRKESIIEDEKGFTQPVIRQDTTLHLPDILRASITLTTDHAVLERLDRIETRLGQIEETQALILKLADRRPVKFVVTLTPIPTEKGELDQMVKKLGVDFALLDNGTAKGTLQPVDSVKLPTTLPAGTTVPTWTSSDPGVVVTAAADGLSAVVAPATPPVLVTGAVITVSATLSDGATVITGSSDPIDIVAGGPAGFQVALT